MDFLEDEIRAKLAELRQSKRTPDLVMARHGWNGCAPATLEAVGNEFGITRERVRQVCSRAEKALSRGELTLPTLKRAIELAEGCAPCKLEELATYIRRSGLSRVDFDGRGLVSAASLFRVPSSVEAVKVEDGYIIVDSELRPYLGRARMTARRLIGARGTATVAEVAAVVAEELATEVSETLERAVRIELQFCPRVVWLDSHRNWLWLKGIAKGRNRLLNNTRKVLSVAKRIDARGLRRALRRDYRMGGYAPPASILLALADAVPELIREGNSVTSVEPYSREHQLSDSEYIIAEIILENGGVMGHAELQKRTLEYGIGLPSFRQRMSHSPIVRKFAVSVYGLAGIEPPRGAVENLTVPSKRERVLQECGWTPDGNIWVTYQLSPATVESGVVSVPSSVRGFLPSELAIVDAGGKHMGTFVIAEKASWGIGPFLRRTGAEAGDTLVIVFNIQEKVACCYLGDESVRDEVLGD
jgi:hypothetical protein